MLKLCYRQRATVDRSLAFLVLLLPIVWAFSPVTNSDTPFERTPDPVVEAMMLAGDVGPTSHVLDLGSGDGRLVLAASRRGAVSAVGVESNMTLIRQSRRAAKAQSLPSVFIHGDIFLAASTPQGLAALANANVVMLYLVPSTMELLEPILMRHLSKGTVIVAHDYPLVEHQYSELWTSESVADKVDINGETTAYVYRYVVGEQQEWGPAAVGTALLNFSRLYPGDHTQTVTTAFATSDGRFKGILHGTEENGKLLRIVLQGAADPLAPVMGYTIRNAASGAVIRRGTTRLAKATGGEKRDAVPLPSLPIPISLSVEFTTVVDDDDL